MHLKFPPVCNVQLWWPQKSSSANAVGYPFAGPKGGWGRVGIFEHFAVISNMLSVSLVLSVFQHPAFLNQLCVESSPIGRFLLLPGALQCTWPQQERIVGGRLQSWLFFTQHYTAVKPSETHPNSSQTLQLSTSDVKAPSLTVHGFKRKQLMQDVSRSASPSCNVLGRSRACFAVHLLCSIAVGLLELVNRR